MTKKKKRKNRENLYPTIAIIGIITLLYFVLSFDDMSREKENLNRTKCPYKIEGNNSSDFIIKYVDSPYCFWCWLEEPILKRLVKTKGDSFKLERYDIRYCTDIVRKYRFSGTPSFVFSMDNATKEYTRVGFIEEEMFYRIICEVTEDCYIN